MIRFVTLTATKKETFNDIIHPFLLFSFIKGIRFQWISSNIATAKKALFPSPTERLPVTNRIRECILQSVAAAAAFHSFDALKGSKASHCARCARKIFIYEKCKCPVSRLLIRPFVLRNRNEFGASWLLTARGKRKRESGPHLATAESIFHRSFAGERSGDLRQPRSRRGRESTKCKFSFFNETECVHFCLGFSLRHPSVAFHFVCARNAKCMSM